MTAAGPSVAATVPAGPMLVINTSPTPVTGRDRAHARTNRSGRLAPPKESLAIPDRICVTRADASTLSSPAWTIAGRADGIGHIHGRSSTPSGHAARPVIQARMRRESPGSASRRGSRSSTCGNSHPTYSSGQSAGS